MSIVIYFLFFLRQGNRANILLLKQIFEFVACKITDSIFEEAEEMLLKIPHSALTF